MPELRIIVRDRFAQEARRTVTIPVVQPVAPEVPVAEPVGAPIAPAAGPVPPAPAVPDLPAVPDVPAAPAAAPRPAPSRQRVRLGQILIEAGLLTHAQLQQTLERQRETGERLGQVVLSMGLGSQEGIASGVAQQLGIEFIRLSDTRLDEETLLRVPEHVARRHQVIPIRVKDQTMVVGMVDPLDIFAIDELRRATGLEIQPAVMTPDDYQRALADYPTLDGTVDAVIQQITTREQAEEALAEETTDRLKVVAGEAPVVRLANLIIVQAVRQGASDIHVEPQEHRVRIRFRVDGALYPAMTPPRHVHAALISRLKIISGMNIAERRVPQDGRIELKVDGRSIDLRVSTIPTSWGEKMVMRILDKSGAFVAVEKLGLQPEDHQRFEQIISRPHGIMLITGPTGSGKTTTLYAILNRLNTPEVNITTIEDPVEYQLPGINQVQVNAKAGLSFAFGLRSFLRQDPDIIMVGEIRDEETARIAIHAALTGHFVLSTLHTNDAPGAIARLTGIGVEPFLVASSIVGVVAQRLVRVLCERCKEPYEPEEDLLARLGLAALPGAPTFYRPVGCPYCHQMGYKGRIGIFEIMPVETTLKNLIVKQATSIQLRQAAIACGMRTLQQDVLGKVASGMISLEEARRVVLMDERASAAA